MQLLNVVIALRLRGLRQYQAAHAIGVSDSHLSRIVLGQEDATPIERRRLAELLQADETWLFSTSIPPALRPIVNDPVAPAAAVAVERATET